MHENENYLLKWVLFTEVDKTVLMNEMLVLICFPAEFSGDLYQFYITARK